jgi:thymidylate synthase (FAD)
MPANLSLDPVTLPMELKFGEAPTTPFENHLDAFKVELVDAPSRESAWRVAWHYVKATWADHPDIDPSSATPAELSKNLEDVFAGRTLPAPMECLGFTFRLSGMSFQQVTHVIRHRAGTFAAQCTGDRDLRGDGAVIPEAVENSPEFLERWKKIVHESKQLYADMTDSKVVSMMDARMILPKCMTSFYYMRLPLKELVGFIYQRMDKQIQPSEDNLSAIMMAIEVAKVIPEFTTMIDFDKPDMHYIKTFRFKEGDKWVSRGTNLYWPEKKNDIFEYHPSDTIYQALREDIKGTHPPEGPTKFEKKWEEYMVTWNALKANHLAWKKEAGV